MIAVFIIGTIVIGIVGLGVFLTLLTQNAAGEDVGDAPGNIVIAMTVFIWFMLIALCISA